MKILAALFILYFNVCQSVFAQDTSSLEAVIQAAKNKNLSQSRQWLKLLHIERNAIGIKKSQIANEQFFFSKKNADPELEMTATLSALLQPASLFAKEITNSRNEKIIDHSEHPICRFPARLHYFKTELKDFDQFWKSLPVVNCTFQNIYLKAVDAKSVSFVFSSYYSDSPGSAFGHTFFRLNRKANVDRQELLDFGVGFAAEVTVTNPIMYALLGLIGGFNGIWTNLPYYYKVREYNDYEARDLWSYDLNLSDEEVLMLTYHLWEVGSSTYNYYFFTQNCAFHMLTVLEAAAPRLHLIEHVPAYYVIPADSMKTLFYEKDLVANISFRPSLRKIFQERIKKLSPSARDNLYKFAQDYTIVEDRTNLSDEEYSTYIDSLLDLVSLRFPDLKASKNEKVYALKERLLKIRSEINFISKPIMLPLKEEERPDRSHGSSRFSVNYLSKNDELGMSYRFAIHDLLDSTVGMPENSQLEFFNFNIKKYEEKIRLQNFNLFKVLNLNPLNFYEKKLSWGLKLGSRRMDIDPGKTPVFYTTGIETQFGYSVELTKQSFPFVLWTMGKADLGYADKEKNNQYGYGALGYQVGLLKRFSTRHALLLTYEKMYPNKLSSYEDLEFELRSSLTDSFSAGLGVSDKHFKGELYFYF